MKQVWIVRPYPHGTLRIEEFLSENIIALGWPDFSSLLGKDYNAIKEILSNQEYKPGEKYAGVRLGANCTTIDFFANKMQVGDLVLVPNANDIYICTIDGDYFFDKNHILDAYPHQRKVKWMGKMQRSDFPRELLGMLRTPRSVVNISKYSDIVYACVDGNDMAKPKVAKTISAKLKVAKTDVVKITSPKAKISKTNAATAEKPKTLEESKLPEKSKLPKNLDYTIAEYPLRPDLLVKISIPNNTTKTEAERLGKFIKTLYFK